MDLIQAWSPYLVVALLLIITRLPYLDLARFLQHQYVTIAWNDIFGTGITASFPPLWSPGAIFIVVSLLTYFMHSMDWDSYKRSWRESGQTLLPASTALVFTVPMVQVFINSSGGAAGLDLGARRSPGT